MELNIGINIKGLRKEKDLTQEQLAEILGVSFQAVSKWERGEGYPDIEMLPAIANYFGVSLDDLAGMEDLRSREGLERYHAQWKALNDAGENEEGARLMREALRQFPGESILMVQLVTSLEKCGGTADVRSANRAEAIALSERLARDDDPEIRNAFLFNLCHSYWKNGETAKAIEHAQKLPNIFKTKENALVMFLQGEDQLRQWREGMLHLTGSLFHQSFVMAHASPPGEAIALLKACCDAARALSPHDNVPELLRQQAMAYARMAQAALALGESEEAMGHLKRCVQYAARCRESVSIADFKKIGLDTLREHPEFQDLLANLLDS